MRISYLKIENFRGIKRGELLIPQHAVLVGDNNIGKSTVLEAIDLVLGPERLSRRPAIDEHDFYAGNYLDAGIPVPITIELIVSDLNSDQTRHFRDHIEWWDEQTSSLLSGPPANSTDKPSVRPALRVGFTGIFDIEEDDFIGSTHFLSPQKINQNYDSFKSSDKRLCGFLYLRTLRTGSRALSLERGSLLDIILRLHDKSFKIWEDVLTQLRVLPVAENPELGITEILKNVQASIRNYMPADSASDPHMRVSDLTRESLRKNLNVFMSTGAMQKNGAEYSAPFQHQGTGTINTLVLALLSLIADLKQNVIFAMEEPEIAIPPHTQKRVINAIRNKSAQAIFTSHSPYVLEEFPADQVIALQRLNGALTAMPALLPPSVKQKAYKTEVRKRFCEALLSRRVLIAEGRTEYDAYTAAARRLHELSPGDFSSLEALGIAVIDAETDSQVAVLANYYKNLGKIVFAVYDQQSEAQRAAILAAVQYPFEAQEKGFENLLLNGTTDFALRRFASQLIANHEWPSHISLTSINELNEEGLKNVMRTFFKWAKGNGAAAEFISSCDIDEIPEEIIKTIKAIKGIVEPVTI